MKFANRTFCAEKQGRVTISPLFGDFSGSCRSIGLFAGELELVDTLETGCGYPLYQAGFEQKPQALAERLTAYGIEVPSAPAASLRTTNRSR